MQASMKCLQKLCKKSMELPRRSCGFEVSRCNVGVIFALCAMFVCESQVCLTRCNIHLVIGTYLISATTIS